MRTSLQIRQERATTGAKMRELIDAAGGAEFSGDQETAWQRMNDEVDALERELTRVETVEGAERGMPAAPLETEPGDPAEREALAATARGFDARRDDVSDDEHEAREAFRTFLRHGKNAITPEMQRALQRRDLQANRPDLGGFLIGPETFVNDLIAAVKDQVFVRQFATVYQLATTESLGVPTLDADISDADWTTELATGSADTAMAIGKRQLVPHPLAKRIKVSRKLIRQATIDPIGLVQDRLAYKFGITEEKAFLLGSGSEQPLGLFTASADGISTARDVVCGSTTAITADGLFDVKFSLKAAYWQRPSVRWIFSRDAIRTIRKLKDSNNNYVWSPGLGPGMSVAAGLPDTIVDTPYAISEYAPNTFTTGQYVALLGDLSYYWIADALDLQVQRLEELYAETNQTGFIGRKETDGMPVLEEAFVRGVLA